MEWIHHIVDNYIELNNLRQYIGSEVIQNEIECRCYKNYYSYEMDDDYALRDAVSTVFRDYGIVPDEFQMWIA